MLKTVIFTIVILVSLAGEETDRIDSESPSAIEATSCFTIPCKDADMQQQSGKTVCMIDQVPVNSPLELMID